MSSEKTEASGFKTAVESYLRRISTAHGLEFGLHALSPELGTNGISFILHGPLGPNWIVLAVSAREAWIELEQCYVSWYIDDQPIVPKGSTASPYAVPVDRPKLQGIRPQFKRVVRGLDDLEAAVGSYAEWIAGTPIDRILLAALTQNWPRGRDTNYLPATPEEAAADTQAALAQEPPKDDGDWT